MVALHRAGPRPTGGSATVGETQGWVAPARRGAVAAALVAILLLAGCSSGSAGRVDVSITSSTPVDARTYGRGECGRQPEAEIVRVHYFDATASAADAYQVLDVHCRVPAAP